MHAAKLENSPRLQRVFKILSKSKKRLSTREIMKRTGFQNCAVHSDIAELRHPVNGLTIRHTQEGKIHYYQMVK